MTSLNLVCSWSNGTCLTESRIQITAGQKQASIVLDMTCNIDGRAHPASLNRREIAPCVYYPSYPHPARQGREPSKQGNRAVICHRERGTGLQEPSATCSAPGGRAGIPTAIRPVLRHFVTGGISPTPKRTGSGHAEVLLQPPAGQTLGEGLRQQEVRFPGLASDKEEPLLRPRDLLIYGAQ